MSKDRHKYEYAVDLAGESAPAKVVRLAGVGHRVLEIGAGPGSITRLLREHNRCRVEAVEIDDTAIAKLAPFCERVHRLDLNDPGWAAAVGGRFDVVVAADVFEHLYDPWAALRAVQDVLAPGGRVVVSLPHVGHNAVICCLADEDFEYRPWGLLDRTHIRFFGLRNIERLFVEAGFKIQRAEFVVVSPGASEFAERWLRLAPGLRRQLAARRHGCVYQVVVEAVPDPAPETGLSLLSLPVPAPALIPDTLVGARRLAGVVLRRLGLLRNR